MKACARYPKCIMPPRHPGACMDKNGMMIPKIKPVEVIKVVTRDKSGKPVRFGKYHV